MFVDFPKASVDRMVRIENIDFLVGIEEISIQKHYSKAKKLQECGQ